MKYVKKPVVVEAIQVPPEGEEFTDEQISWIRANDLRDIVESIGAGCVNIETLEGVMTASPGDWIIRGVQGELYPCKPDIFAETYDVHRELDFKMRVVKEREELFEKMKKLDNFIISSGGPFDELPKKDRRLLIEQMAAMRVYDKILVERISNFAE